MEYGIMEHDDSPTGTLKTQRFLAGGFCPLCKVRQVAILGSRRNFTPRRNGQIGMDCGRLLPSLVVWAMFLFLLPLDSTLTKYFLSLQWQDVYRALVPLLYLWQVQECF